MNLLRRSLAFASLLVLATAAPAFAQVVAGAPGTIDYQGKALDATGAPLANSSPANFEMLFRIYDSQEGGAIVWSERQIVTVSRGMFSVRLGEGAAISGEGQVAQTNLPEAFNGRERFLGVTIVISGQTPVEILPRLAFLATPYAYVASKAVSAERLILNPSSSAPLSALNVSQVSYATQAVNTNTTLSDQNHTVIVDATSAAVTISVPTTTTRREYYIAKRDSSLNVVTVVPPAGGTINGGASIRLKVRGESVVIQNIGNNDWWVISGYRDLTPVGTIIASGSTTAPPGYIACNGATLDRASAIYSDLFSAIGVAFGAPSSTQFNVPDLRGLFLRGRDGGRNLDGDRNSRTALQPNGNAGDAIGSYQGDVTGEHNHSFSASGNTGEAGGHNHFRGSGGGGARGLARQSSTSDSNRTTDGADNGGRGSELDVVSGVDGIPWDGGHTHSFSVNGTTGNSGGRETRPKNVNVEYYIKY